jgi:uncharacterized protein
MVTREYRNPLQLSKDIISHYEMKKIAFYDIETTGFDKEENRIILISLGYLLDCENIIIKQYFAESLEEETLILKTFAEALKDFNRWSSFNGIAFDEPFLVKRMEQNQIKFKVPKEHIDLYRFIRPYYKQLGMERCNLKSVERHIGIERADQIDGAMSVHLYFQYLHTGDIPLIDVIMLHNYEDVLSLPKLFRLLYEIDLNSNLQREDSLTKKQLKYIKFLLIKKKISIKVNYNKISKKTAGKIIEALVKPEINIDEIYNIIKNSY